MQTKKIQKNFFEKKYKKNFFWKKLICGKVPCLSQKMMIYYKMAMSGVYENVFQTSKNYLEGAKISFWNCKVWGGGPCNTATLVDLDF